jgi:hypothetical protein
LRIAAGFTGVEGVWSKGDPMAFAQVDLIDATTVIKGDLFVGGTFATKANLTTYTSTTAVAAGATTVTQAFSVTPTAFNQVIYCTKGLNYGLYRFCGDASTTTHVISPDWPYAIAIGDTFKIVNLTIGTSKLQIDALSLYLDAEGDYAANYYWAEVEEINLAPDGKEYCLFRFNPLTFLGVRA